MSATRCTCVRSAVDLAIVLPDPACEATHRPGEYVEARPEEKPMRIRLTLDIDRGQTAASPPGDREVEMGSLVERADPHPEVERPIGFRRADPDHDS